MSRNWGRDDPVADAEDWASREDERPLLGYCEICGCELRGSSSGWDADDGYEINGDYVCADHLHEYFKDQKIR